MALFISKTHSLRHLSPPHGPFSSSSSVKIQNQFVRPVLTGPYLPSLELPKLVFFGMVPSADKFSVSFEMTASFSSKLTFWIRVVCFEQMFKILDADGAAFSSFDSANFALLPYSFNNFWISASHSWVTFPPLEGWTIGTSRERSQRSFIDWTRFWRAFKDFQIVKIVLEMFSKWHVETRANQRETE